MVFIRLFTSEWEFDFEKQNSIFIFYIPVVTYFRGAEGILLN